jgi:predicted protein tyrosine phosphatase
MEEKRDGFVRNMKKIVIKNENNIREYVAQVREDFILISITNPRQDFVEIPETQFCRGIIRLRFHDTEQEKKDYDYFKRRDARAIKRFVLKNNAGLIICQCRAGLSRSPAIGAALAKYFGLDAERFFTSGEFVPNLLVFKKMLKIFGMKNVEAEVVRHRQLYFSSLDQREEAEGV